VRTNRPVEPEPSVVTLGSAACLVFIAAALVISIRRLTYDGELEFMGGAMLDLAERVRDGRPLYAPVSLDSTAFVYGPGWFMLVGSLGKVMPLRAAARCVAAAANLGSAFAVAALARRRCASKTRVLACVALYFAGYALTGCWQDLERVDALATALVLAGVFAWTSPRERVAASSGLFVGAALVCKQTVLPIALAMLGAELMAKRWRRAALFTLGAAVVPCGLWLAASPSSREGFTFYALELPRQHGISLERVTFVARDLARAFLLTAVTVAASAALRLREARESRGAVTLAAPLVGALVCAILARLHAGGWPNVVMPWAALAAAATAELPTSGRAAALLPYALVGQLAVLGPSLVAAIPTSEHRRGAKQVEEAVRMLETKGEVWVMGRGHLTARRHAHITALGDVFRAGGELPEDIEEALNQKRFAAIVIDDGGELLGDRDERLLRAVVGNYVVVAHLDSGKALPTGCEALPSWVLVPRSRTLDDLGRSPLSLLRREERRVGGERQN
jgi:hypothetical protein